MTKPAATNTTKVITEILAGRHDGKLVDIVDAVGHRLRSSTQRVCWKLTLDGESWTEQDVTSGELAFAEKLLGVSYLSIEPRVNLEHRIALVVAHLHKIRDVATAEAVKRAEAMTLADQEDLFGMYEVGDNPKGDPAASETS